jgi:hypothetical protein
MPPTPLLASPFARKRAIALLAQRQWRQDYFLPMMNHSRAATTPVTHCPVSNAVADAPSQPQLPSIKLSDPIPGALSAPGTFSAENPRGTTSGVTQSL